MLLWYITHNCLSQYLSILYLFKFLKIYISYLLCGTIGAQSAVSHIYSDIVFSENDKKPLPMDFISNGFSYGNFQGQALFKPASQPEQKQ